MREIERDIEREMGIFIKRDRGRERDMRCRHVLKFYKRCFRLNGYLRLFVYFSVGSVPNPNFVFPPNYIVIA